MMGKPSPELSAMVRGVIERQLGFDYPWPGNVRELEQSVRRILLKCTYEGDEKSVAPDLRSKLIEGIAAGDIRIQNLVQGYCYLLYRRHGTFEEVARRAGLDRRTVKKHIKLYMRDHDGQA
jgi:transcriptional regulator of acetoin/glycerol metabolism